MSQVLYLAFTVQICINDVDQMIPLSTFRLCSCQQCSIRLHGHALLHLQALMKQIHVQVTG